MGSTLCGIENENIEASMCGSEKSKKSGLKSIAERAKQLRKSFADIGMKLSKLEEDMDRAVRNLTDLLMEVGAASHSIPHGKSVRISELPDDATKKLLARISASGAASLVINRLPTRKGLIMIDGLCFELPPVLTDLLEILSDKGEGFSAGSLPYWKGAKEIARRLEEEYGRTFSKHSIVQNVSRLKKLLFERGDINPELVQRNDNAAYRFALKLT